MHVAPLNVAKRRNSLNVVTHAKPHNCPDAKCRNADAKRRTWLEGLVSNLNNTQVLHRTNMTS